MPVQAQPGFTLGAIRPEDAIDDYAPIVLTRVQEGAVAIWGLFGTAAFLAFAGAIGLATEHRGLPVVLALLLAGAFLFFPLRFASERRRQLFDPTHGLIVDEFSIMNFNFSKSFSDAIEAKTTAEQNSLKAERDLQRVEVEHDKLHVCIDERIPHETGACHIPRSIRFELLIRGQTLTWR